jgi:lipoyl(octanoyl) transferase
MNMEADRYFGEVEPPVLPLVRLYTWDVPTISLGCNQNPIKRIDLPLCKQRGIPVVQRPTGGRELLHGHDLCYCVAIPHQTGMTAVEAKRIFSSITDIFNSALAQMGVMAEGGNLTGRPSAIQGPCFVQTDAGELSVKGKKLVASAQRVFDHCIIQEGSIPLNRSQVDLTEFLYVENKESLKRAMDANTAFLFENLERPVPIESIVECIKQAFEGHYGSPAGSADELLERFQRNNRGYLWYY